MRAPLPVRPRLRTTVALAVAAVALLWLPLPTGPRRQAAEPAGAVAELAIGDRKFPEAIEIAPPALRPAPLAPVAEHVADVPALPFPAPLSVPDADSATAAAGLLAAAEHRPLATLFGLRVQTIVLDPGHGGIDPGAIGARRLREKDLTLDVAKRLAILLRRDEGFRVLLTRKGDETVSLAQRVALANAAGADLFVSIHANTLVDARANAVETYYFGAPEDPLAWRLAEAENAGSGMAIGAFRELVAKLGDTLKHQESLALARSVQMGLLDGVMHRSGPPDGGVKIAPFVVLLGVEVPSVLAEVTCISSPREATRLAQPGYREQIAAALSRGIVAYAAARNGNSEGEIDHGKTISEGENRGQGNG